MTIHKKPFSTNRLATLALLTSPLFLVACGGSSSSSPESPPQPDTVSLSGTAAIGAAISDAPVSARCEDGSGFLEDMVTDSNGRFRGKVAEGALPCALRVRNPDGTFFHSLAVEDGTVNITPLTDLAVALAGEDPGQWFSEGDLTRVAGILEQRVQELLNTLTSLGYSIPEKLDPVRGTLSIGDSHDQVLDQLGAAIQDSAVLEDYQQLAVLLRDGNLNQIPAIPEKEEAEEQPVLAPSPGTDDGNKPSTENFSACYNPELYQEGAELVTQTRIGAPGSGAYTMTTTQRILEPTTFDGSSVQARQVQQTYANVTTTKTSYYTIDLASGATSEYGDVFESMGSTTVQVYQPSLDTVYDIGLNQTYRHSYSVETNGTQAEVSFAQTFLGIETVQVAAGTIEACKMHNLSVFDGQIYESVDWLAVDTGIQLKTVSPDEANPQTVMELQSATLNGQTIY